MDIGINIKKARLRAELTQKELADMINVKHNSISDWENDKTEPNVDNIADLCKALRVSPDQLLGISVAQQTIDDTDTEKVTPEQVESDLKELFEKVGLLGGDTSVSPEKLALIIKLIKAVVDSDI